MKSKAPPNLGPDFTPTPRSPGEPKEEPFPEPESFQGMGALTHRKQVLGHQTEREEDHGAI
jgi:hypothetical protein